MARISRQPKLRGPCMSKLYFEDMTLDRRFKSGPYTMTLEEIKTFAGQYDPQPFHLDEEAAKKTCFGGRVASGWHTAAVTMRLMASGEMQLAGGALGAGIEQLQWPKPVKPGDTLRIETETVEA